MSAPQTNLKKQERWHRAPLIGMVAGIVFVGVLSLWLTGVFSVVEKIAPPPVTDVTAPVTKIAPAPAQGPDQAQPKADPVAPADN